MGGEAGKSRRGKAYKKPKHRKTSRSQPLYAGQADKAKQPCRNTRQQRTEASASRAGGLPDTLSV